jgi:hypothetical protein
VALLFVLLGSAAIDLGCAAARRAPAAREAPAPEEPARGLAHERLHATLWMHTSAEYPASVRQDRPLQHRHARDHAGAGRGAVSVTARARRRVA